MVENDKKFGEYDNTVLIIDVENNIPFLVNRPKGSPKVVVRIFCDTDNITPTGWVNLKQDSTGRKYYEAVWG